MDVVKVFVEDPAALGGGSRLPLAPGPADDSLEAFLDAVRAPASAFARAYLAGTRLGGGRPHVGLTALDPSAWVDALMAWADGRTWTQLTRGGRATGILPKEARAALSDPMGTLALGLADGPIPADILATVVLGDAAEAAHATETLLRADAAVALFLPEPAHDGHDWSLVARSGLREALAEAFRAHPAPAGVRRFVLPRVRGEARFYFEQWADAPPAGAVEV